MNSPAVQKSSNASNSIDLQKPDVTATLAELPNFDRVRDLKVPGRFSANVSALADTAKSFVSKCGEFLLAQRDAVKAHWAKHGEMATSKQFDTLLTKVAGAGFEDLVRNLTTIQQFREGIRAQRELENPSGLAMQTYENLQRPIQSLAGTVLKATSDRCSAIDKSFKDITGASLRELTPENVAFLKAGLSIEEKRAILANADEIASVLNEARVGVAQLKKKFEAFEGVATGLLSEVTQATKGMPGHLRQHLVEQLESTTQEFANRVGKASTSAEIAAAVGGAKEAVAELVTSTQALGSRIKAGYHVEAALQTTLSDLSVGDRNGNTKIARATDVNTVYVKIDKAFAGELHRWIVATTKDESDAFASKGLSIAQRAAAAEQLQAKMSHVTETIQKVAAFLQVTNSVSDSRGISGKETTLIQRLLSSDPKEDVNAAKAAFRGLEQTVVMNVQNHLLRAFGDLNTVPERLDKALQDLRFVTKTIASLKGTIADPEIINDWDAQARFTKARLEEGFAKLLPQQPKDSPEYLAKLERAFDRYAPKEEVEKVVQSRWQKFLSRIYGSIPGISKPVEIEPAV